MSDEQFSSKRERQKARRAERLQREASQAKAEDRRRMLTYGLVVALVVALIAFLVYRQIEERRLAAEEAELAEARAEELGCTPGPDKDLDLTQQPDYQADLGGGHISGSAEALQAEAPEVIYPDEPPSSGRHVGQVVPTGVFDVRIDPRFTTHNLEHGYIVAWYGPDAPEDQVEELKSWAQEQIDGDFPKIVVAEYYKPLPEDANFAYTAWFYRQMCEEFDPAVASTFTRAHYDIEGEGPEKGIPTHNVGSQGVIDPEGEDLFLPPLAEQLGAESALEETQEASPATTADPLITESPAAGDAEPAEGTTEAAVPEEAVTE